MEPYASSFSADIIRQITLISDDEFEVNVSVFTDHQSKPPKWVWKFISFYEP